MNYRISVGYDDYFCVSNKIVSKNTELIGEAIYFDTDSDSLKVLDEANIVYMIVSDKKKEHKKLFKNNGGIIIGLIIVLFLLYINSYRVTDIIFNESYPINNNISDAINNDMKRILCFNFHKNNYDELSSELRKIYYEYEWISIYREGTVIKVTISDALKFDTPSDINLGPIYAKCDGIIESYEVYDGKFECNLGDYIKKDTLLISGDNAKGYVLSHVYLEREIKIDKKEVTRIKENECDKYYSISFFNLNSFNLGKNKTFNISKKDKVSSFVIPYFVTINCFIETKESDIIKMYDKDSGKIKAKSLIFDDFYNNKLLNREEIERCELLECTEFDTYYVYKFLLKELISVGVVNNEAFNRN